MKTDFQGPDDQSLPVCVTEAQAANLICVPLKTLRRWRYAGDLRGLFFVKGRRITYRTKRLLTYFFPESPK